MSHPERIGKYRLLRLLGSGGMGVVHEAEDLVLRRRVALKILNPRGQLSDLARKRFRREAEVAASIVHPNVVAVHDAGEEDGSLYLVMELVEGTTLDALFARSGGSVPARAEMVEKIARGVAAAHAHGVVHRDLKPGNIYVTPKGEPKVGDFGLAHLVDSEQSLTRTGAQIGTPSYMSPEQVRGDKAAITPATDVHALGAILYEALAGRPPYAADTVQRVYQRIINEDPGSLRKANARVPAELQAICEKALAKDPRRRYPDAGKFAEDLRRFREGLPVEARVPGLGYRAWRSIRRRWWAWTAAVVLLAGTVAAAAIVKRQGRLSAELARTSELSSLNALAKDISDAYADSRLATFDILRRLEDHHVGEKPEPDIPALLDQARAAMKPVAERHAESRVPEAWLGLLLHFGKDPEGLRKLEAAAAASDRDPLPHVLLARARLADYVRDATAPDYMSLGVSHMDTAPFAESAEQQARREGCRRTLRAALDFPVWPHLRQGREYRVFAAAVEHLGAGRYADAGALLAELEEDPELGGQARYLLARVLALEDRLVEAAIAAERLVARPWPAVCKLAGLIRLMEVHRLFRKREGDLWGEIDRAVADFRRGLSIDPKSLPLLRALVVTRRFIADARRMAGEDAITYMDEAIAEAEAGLLIHPDDPPIVVSLASCLRLKGDHLRHHGSQALPLYDRAIGDLERVHRRMIADPSANELLLSTSVNLSNALTTRALAAVEAGLDLSADLERVERIVTEVPAKFAGHPELLAARARARYASASLRRRSSPAGALRKVEESISDFDTLLSRTPDHPEHLAGRGESWSLKAELLRSEPDAVRALESGLKDFTAALELRPTFAFARSQRALLLLKFSDHASLPVSKRIPLLEMSAEDAALLLRNDPGNQVVWGRRCVVHLRLAGLTEETARKRDFLLKAVQDGDEAVKLGPRDARAWFNRGAGWFTLGVLEPVGPERSGTLRKAAADFRQSAGISPSYGLAWSHLGMTSALLGDVDEARAAWEKALQLNPGDADIQRRLRELPPRE